jgi:transcription elongation GreA/GreB family factor
MSRAFTREDDNENAITGLGERPISPHRNLVTKEGLAAIDDLVTGLRADLATAEAAADREQIARLSRDLRYWSARRESAELSVPETGSPVVRFGMTVTIEDDDRKIRRWKIVGEDEADASKGSVSHVSPMAQALFGRSVGDLVTVAGRQWEVIALGTE